MEDVEVLVVHHCCLSFPLGEGTLPQSHLPFSRLFPGLLSFRQAGSLPQSEGRGEPGAPLAWSPQSVILGRAGSCPT